MKSDEILRPFQYQGVEGQHYQPKTIEALSRFLAWASHHAQKVTLQPEFLSVGLSPKSPKPPEPLDEAYQKPAPPLWLDLSALRQVRHYSAPDFIIEVETGITFGALNALLAEQGQIFPLSYPAHMRLSTVLAEDLPALETGLPGYGYPRDFVLKTECHDGQGQKTISGANVVKNVAGYDLAKLYVGARHTFGVLSAVTVKVHPKITTASTYGVPFSDFLQAMHLAERLLLEELPLSLCVLSRQGDEPSKWILWFQLLADAPILAEAAPILQALFTETQSLYSPSPLHEEDTLQMKQRLYNQSMPFLSDITLIEMALPLAQCVALTQTLNRQSAFAQASFQLRPAAGLLYLSAPCFPLTAFDFLKNEVERLNGQGQILQLSHLDQQLCGNPAALIASWNGQSNPGQAGLCQSLKQALDPNETFWSPMLPL